MRSYVGNLLCATFNRSVNKVWWGFAHLASDMDRKLLFYFTVSYGYRAYECEARWPHAYVKGNTTQTVRIRGWQGNNEEVCMVRNAIPSAGSSFTWLLKPGNNPGALINSKCVAVCGRHPYNNKLLCLSLRTTGFLYRISHINTAFVVLFPDNKRVRAAVAFNTGSRVVYRQCRMHTVCALCSAWGRVQRERRLA